MFLPTHWTFIYNFTKFIFTITHTQNQDIDTDNIVVPKDGIKKLHQLTTLWPKSVVKISNVNGLISLEIVSHGHLMREREVQVDCFFKPAINDYVINPPTMSYNCIVNSKNLKQMLEFCMINDGVVLEIKNKSLMISNTDFSLATMVELEELIEKPSERIKLSAEANNLIISFLNKLVNKFNLVYLLFIEHESAFSIRINFDEVTTIQIYTVHH